MTAVSDQINVFNNSVVEEFRENAGVVGGMFAGVPVLLLHTKGAKSGAARINPLAYRPVGDAWAVFGSFGGAPTNPAWYHNLLAHPDVDIEVGTETVAVARPGHGGRRARADLVGAEA